MSEATPEIRSLAPTDGAAAVEVLMDGFQTDPDMRWCFMADAAGYEDRLRGYMETGHAWHTGLGFPVWAAYLAGELVGVSYEMRPDAVFPTEPELSLFTRMRPVCGDAAVDRFAQYNEEVDAATPDHPAHVVALLAVRGVDRGRGTGGRLLQRVIAEAGADAAADGVMLATGNPNNLPFYARHGFEAVGRATVGEITEHVLFRPCSDGDAS